MRQEGIQPAVRDIDEEELLVFRSALRRRYTDEQILAELKACAERLGRSPTMRELADDDGSPLHPQTVIERFGSWNAAKRRAGLAPRRFATREDLLARLRELGEELGPAAFGENLSTAGGTEEDVCIGDRWFWGDAVLEVCQPRSPCFKLAMHRGRGDIGRRLRETGRTGWYLRVLEPGRVPVAGPITVEPHFMGATVRVVWDAARRGGGVPLEVIDALLSVDPLARNWKLALAERLPD